MRRTNHCKSFADNHCKSRRNANPVKKNQKKKLWLPPYIPWLRGEGRSQSQSINRIGPISCAAAPHPTPPFSVFSPAVQCIWGSGIGLRACSVGCSGFGFGVPGLGGRGRVCMDQLRINRPSCRVSFSFGDSVIRVSGVTHIIHHKI